MGVNLGKLTKVDLVAREVINGHMTYEQGSASLDEILVAPDPHGRRVRVLCYVLSLVGRALYARYAVKT